MTKESNQQTNNQHATAVVPASEGKQESMLYAEPISHIGNFAVTNALTTSVAAVLIIAALAVLLRAKLREVPKGLQNIFEVILESALALCDQVTGNRKTSERLLPLAFSVFIFILANNWLGLLPLGGLGIAEKTSHGAAFVPFLRSGTADINTTLALAVMAVLGANLFGIFSIGVWKTFNKYVNLKALGEILTKAPREPIIVIVAPITFFVGLLELVGEFAKIASLSFRLFGNIFAGEVLLAAMGAMLPYALPIPFIFLEVFVGAIQAFIFSVLVLVYFTIAAENHQGGEGY